MLKEVVNTKKGLKDLILKKKKKTTWSLYRTMEIYHHPHIGVRNKGHRDLDLGEEGGHKPLKVTPQMQHLPEGRSHEQ